MSQGKLAADAKKLFFRNVHQMTTHLSVRTLVMCCVQHHPQPASTVLGNVSSRHLELLLLGTYLASCGTAVFSGPAARYYLLTSKILIRKTAFPQQPMR